MSTPTTLDSILKGATAVTSLDSDDRLLAFDTNGKQKKISRASLISQATSSSRNVEHGESDWLRVAIVNFNSSGLIKVAVAWGVVNPAMIIFSLLVHTSGTYKINCLSRLSSSSMFSKIRLVYKSASEGYIDVYAPTSKTEHFMVSLMGCHNVTLDLGADTNATVPTGYSVKEFDSSNWGGVIGFASMHYVLTVQAGKGGRHEHTGCNQQISYAFRRICGAWEDLRPRHGIADWLLSSCWQLYNCQSPQECLQLRKSRGLWRRVFPSTGILSSPDYWGARCVHPYVVQLRQQVHLLAWYRRNDNQRRVSHRKEVVAA